jgi:anaerobic selenocysteine-containing dehydrogenase
MATHDVKTLCPYCGVGCGLIATTDGERLLSVRADPDHPANLGRLCPKGATVAQTVDVKTRLRSAMVRDRQADPFRPVSPGEAVQHVAQRLDRILQSHGPQGISFYLSGQMTTESQYVFNKFGKGSLRTNHVDSNSRLCMSSAAAGMTLSLGSDGPPTSYSDIEHADTFLFVGSNAADTHPVTFGRVERRMERPTSRMVVIDPRRTETAKAADVHLPIRPGTDLTVLNGLMYLLDVWKKTDQTFIADHTEGWDAVRALSAEYPPSRVAYECGISVNDLVNAAHLIGDARNLLTFWTMGVSQTIAGTFSANAIINLHLALGQIGRPGCGPFSLTGQPNAMGGRSVGYMAHLLPGQRRIADPEHRRQMEQLWGLTEGTIYPHAGYDAVRLFDALESGDVRAIWIVGTNPAASMPNLPKVRRALEKAELVVVQDAYHPTETAGFAHVLLPAAVNLEQAGTFCNSERRVTLMQPAAKPPGDAQPDWWWPRHVAAEMGFTRGMWFASAAEIFDEFAATTAGRPDDQSGLSHDLLARDGPQQWPYPAGGTAQAWRYTDGVFPTPSGKARFFARPQGDPDESPSPEFPLLLTTGRVPNQWHTRTKTGLVDALNKGNPAPFLSIHPTDAESLKIRSGQRVKVRSRRGTAVSVAKVDLTVTPGVVFMPIHWNELWGEAASPNEATSDAHDAISKQPSLKYCPVAVSAIDVPEEATPAEAAKKVTAGSPIGAA